MTVDDDVHPDEVLITVLRNIGRALDSAHDFKKDWHRMQMQCSKCPLGIAHEMLAASSIPAEATALLSECPAKIADVQEANRIIGEHHGYNWS